MLVSTYSICACDLGARQWGVAVQSRVLAVGCIVPWAEPLAGAIATQSWANPRFGPDGLALLREGLTAAQVVERLTAADDDRAQRQLGVVDAEGGSASYTGEECKEWAGGRTGPGYAAQGNILVSGQTVDALADTFERSSGPLADRLLASLVAGEAAGGDSRGRQSAALLVVCPDGGYGGFSDVAVDLRVDDHPEPIEELARLHALHTLYFGQTPEEDWLEVDEPLRAEIRERLTRLGFDDPDLDAAFRAWVGRENLEDRTQPGTRIDPVVLAELRRR
jgi:uncharacterized Ntn-hydrolase superfamily protein